MVYRVTTEGFLEIEITQDMEDRASALASDLGELKNSIRKGEGNLAGFLGEEVVLAAFPRAVRDNSYQHDILLNGSKFEVKTKDRTVPPRSFFEASIANHNPNQRTDYYIFVSLLRENDQYVKGYITGYIPRKTYFQKADFLTEGEEDPSNGWVVLTDCYNLRYDKLHRFKNNAR